MRTVLKKETYNSTTKNYHYPQTPARVHLSLWPAGSDKNEEGTINWAGGLIDWNSEDIQANQYYYAMFKDVTVDCYKPPSGANITGSKSYIYTSLDGDESSVATTDKSTVLKSLLGTGTDMEKDYPKPVKKPEAEKPDEPDKTDKDERKTSTSKPSASATKEVATIPGLTGAGPGTDGQRGETNGGNRASNSGNTGSSSNSGSSGSTGNSDSSGSTGNTGSGSDSGSESTGSGSTTAPDSESSSIGGFSQGQVATANNALQKGEHVLQGSMFAVMVAFIGMLLI